VRCPGGPPRSVRGGLAILRTGFKRALDDLTPSSGIESYTGVRAFETSSESRTHVREKGRGTPDHCCKHLV